MLPTNGKVIGSWVKLDSVNRLLELKLLDYLIISLIYYVESSLLSTRNDVVSLTAYSIDVRFMDISNLLAKTADS